MNYFACMPALVNSIIINNNNNNKRMHQDSDADWKPNAAEIREADRIIARLEAERNSKKQKD